MIPLPILFVRQNLVLSVYDSPPNSVCSILLEDVSGVSWTRLIRNE